MRHRDRVHTKGGEVWSVRAVRATIGHGWRQETTHGIYHRRAGIRGLYTALGPAEETAGSTRPSVDPVVDPQPHMTYQPFGRRPAEFDRAAQRGRAAAPSCAGGLGAHIITRGEPDRGRQAMVHPWSAGRSPRGASARVLVRGTRIGGPAAAGVLHDCDRGIVQGPSARAIT